MTRDATSAATPRAASRTFHASRAYLPLLACLVLTSLTTFWLYSTTQRLFRWSIDERLIGLASVAAIQFDPAELDEIVGPESVPSPVYRDVVERLDTIRRETRKVRYAYILRQTDDPLQLQFVADADSLEPDVPIDLNGDGVIDELDALVHPGDPYDVSEFPEFRAAAFVMPFVDPELTHDQWGTFLAGTAPIRTNDNAPARYVLGLDLDVSEFQVQTNLALRPFVGFVLFLLLVITALTIGLAVMWRRQVDQLAEIDRQKDELIGIVSHQLAGPVTGVRWNLEEMRDGQFGTLSPAQRDEVEQLLAAVLGLADLTSLLLDVSRIELGRLRMDRHEVDLRQLFRDVAAQATQQAQQKGVKLRTHLPASRVKAVLDPRLLRMAVDNLLSNAIKYTPSGGRVELAVRIDAGRLRCTVQDTGVGIPEADQPQIFGKLYRASNVRDVRGHGFGLYVAKGAIEQQGGRLDFTSREGVGTTFTLELPLE